MLADEQCLWFFGILTCCALNGQKNVEKDLNSYRVFLKVRWCIYNIIIFAIKCLKIIKGLKSLNTLQKI